MPNFQIGKSKYINFMTSYEKFPQFYLFVVSRGMCEEYIYIYLNW